MRFRPPPFEITDRTDPFANDTIDRRTHIEALTRLVDNIEGPCVLAIDAQWGFGKTAFLKMLAQHMRNEGIPVAEFNAWETDFSDDPLMALYAALQDHFARWPDGKADGQEAVLNTGFSVLSKVASATIPFVPDIAGVVNDYKRHTETQTRTRLRRYQDCREAIGAFKIALQKVTDESPLVVCVDELDRCRPDYAIKFLEATKHIFEVDRVIFLLAVNLTELANSVGALYGADFNARAYLRRFVDRSMNLPQGDRTLFLQDLMESTQLEKIGPRSDVAGILNAFLLARHVSLRDIEQSIMHVGTVWNAMPRRPHTELYILAICQVVLRTVAPDVSQRISAGECSDLEALQGLNRLLNRPDDWWKARYSADHWNYPDEQSYPSLYMEVLLIGWNVFSDTEGRSALLDLRRVQAQDEDNQNVRQYPLDVVAMADQMWTEPTAMRRFSHITSLVETVAADSHGVA